MLKFLRVFTRPSVQLLAIIATGILVYANSLHVPFVFDDDFSIVLNRSVHGLANFVNGFQLPNRIVAYLTFALNYEVGALNVTGYHMVNVAIHICNALLVYALVRMMTRTLRASDVDDDADTKGDATLAFAVALLFVVHPIQTQAVTYVVQRITSLATLFYLCALLFYARCRLAWRTGAPFTSRSVLPWYGVSLLCTILAMRTKEIAFTIPLALLLYDWIIFRRPGPRRFLALAPFACTMALIPATMINASAAMGQILSDVKEATAVQTTLPRGDYLVTQFSVMVTYLRLLLFPANQNLDYDYPIYRSLMEPRPLLSLLTLVALLTTAVILWRTASRRSGDFSGERGSRTVYCRLAAFGIFWFFLTLSVESSLIPIADVIFEHRVYLPSFGIFLACAALAVWSVNHLAPRAPRLPVAAAISFLAVTLVFAVTTVKRNTVWSSAETLWQDVTAKSPRKARGYNNLGTWYGSQERVAESIQAYEAALRIEPKHPEALSNVVLLYVSAGRNAEASAACRTLLQVDPNNEKDLKIHQILAMKNVQDPALKAVQEVCSAPAPAGPVSSPVNVPTPSDTPSAPVN